MLCRPLEVDKCPNGNWAQCGGLGWTGKPCCAAETKCVPQNEHYFQCKETKSLTSEDLEAIRMGDDAKEL